MIRDGMVAPLARKRVAHRFETLHELPWKSGPCRRALEQDTMSAALKRHSSTAIPTRHGRSPGISSQTSTLIPQNDNSQRQKIRDQLLAFLGQHAFGMELHAFDKKALVTQTHDGP